MQHLEYPSEETWEDRRLWFEERQQKAAAEGVERLSEQAAALVIELQAVFCAGAWAASVILAAAVVDAQDYYRGFPGDRGGEDRSWLRNLRNRLLHEDRTNPALTIEDHWMKRDEWRRLAKRAVLAAFDVLYGKQEGRRRR
jgi:hypothetical protein